MKINFQAGNWQRAVKAQHLEGPKSITTIFFGISIFPVLRPHHYPQARVGAEADPANAEAVSEADGVPQGPLSDATRPTDEGESEQHML